MGHLRATVWGPAEFVGLPPWWLVAEGLLVGLLGAGAIIGTTLYGAWTGRPALADGESGLVCAAAVALYVSLMGAGRALVGIVALLGVCLALHTAGRGRRGAGGTGSCAVRRGDIGRGGPAGGRRP